jgi:hypothetical protein
MFAGEGRPSVLAREDAVTGTKDDEAEALLTPLGLKGAE